MTYTDKQLTHYVEAHIKAMVDTVDWAKDEKNMGDWTREQSRDWALKRIESEYDRAKGAINCLKFYLDMIDEYTFAELSDLVFNTRSEQSKRCWAEIR